ncbi:MAG: hypothetical protein WA125_16645 [Desulfosporosinus sp.]
MIFGRILNTKLEDVNNLSTGDLLTIIRAFEDGQGKDFVDGIFPAVVDELANRHVICVW